MKQYKDIVSNSLNGTRKAIKPLPAFFIKSCPRTTALPKYQVVKVEFCEWSLCNAVFIKYIKSADAPVYCALLNETPLKKVN